ncbi:MAG: hypothetical protein CBB68_08400 [Rhodospirillaceae bacterium TMED8]|nr:hypothetical protein [Magnetovibrio sp.]OUT50391.1 MAG: hypothetical protein CBB68_08400 [Rhodospirillaceae bacterium TMED8]|tara:strand:+ start:459 stop:650 length:192 start_codon:yes stop_codon:yes gene_type:complete
MLALFAGTAYLPFIDVLINVRQVIRLLALDHGVEKLYRPERYNQSVGKRMLTWSKGNTGCIYE